MAFTSKTSLVAVAMAMCLWASSAPAQTVPRGVVVDPVPCVDDPAQTYALYLPSTYSPERSWSVLLAFHPAALGRLMAERFQTAAEQYGYIVAASNNARNGPHALSAAAAQAMGADVSRRFSVDRQRVYLTGMSGGARVALGIALGNPSIAGVVASSAGYPDDFEGQLSDEGRRVVAMMTLRDRLSTLARKAAADSDTPDRRQARRLLRWVAFGASRRVQDREYLALLEQHRLQGR